MELAKEAKGTVHPVTYHEGTEGFRSIARLIVIQSRSECFRQEQNLLPLTEFEHRIVQPVASRYVGPRKL